MTIDKTKIISAFYGGISRDDKSQTAGAVSNIEEVDIFSNADFVQAEQIMSTDTFPSASNVYAYSVGDDDIMYAYGKETAANKVRLFSVADGGSDNPGSWATLFTSSDATSVATTVSPVEFFKTTESPATYLYYIAGTGSAWLLKRYSITGTTEATVGTLSGLTGSFDRPTMKKFFGSLYICHGQFIASIDSDGTFTEKAFTLPNSQIAVDIIPVSDVAIVLARNANRFINETTGYWWDLEAATQFDDQFKIPFGGPQFISNWKENIIIFCAIAGIGKFYKLSGAFPGAQPLEISDKIVLNCGVETSTQPISSPKMVSQRNGQLYFGLFKTDKTGIYSIGQLDSQKPLAFILSKRFHTTDYSLHSPTALLVHGPNFYGAFIDNGTASTVRCESNNSPTRSSTALIESIWYDDGRPAQTKQLARAYINSYPLSASTALTLHVGKDFTATYTQVNRPDNSIFNTLNGLLGFFKPAAFSNNYAYRFKVVFTSNGVNSPKLQSVGLRYFVKELL